MLAGTLLVAGPAAAQCTVRATSGYQVSMAVEPVAVVPHRSPCPFGYNYDLQFRYNVSITGPAAPAALYTLQARFTCAAAGNDKHFSSLPLSGGAGYLTTITRPYRGNSDCATATPASLDCNHVSMAVEGPDLARTDVVCDYRVPLPVTLIAFEARTQGSRRLLRWRTALEVNTREFAVEKSDDATTWAMLGRVVAAGTSGQPRAYELADPGAAPGVVYYRLRQTDQDGTVTYSHVISALTADAGIVLTPNPNATDHLTIQGLRAPREWALLLRNSLGHAVWATLLSTAELELPPLPAGSYFAELRHAPSGRALCLKYSKE